MDSTERGKRVVVIGGGITGLTAAYRLTQAAQGTRSPLEVILLEASGRLGGRYCDALQDGLLMEQGPDCFLSAKPWGVRLCEELGLGDEIISTTTQYRQSFIVRGGKLVPVPQGFYLMAPGSWRSLITTPVFSWRGKLRMALDLVVPRRTATDDESLAQFVTRRLGREALERMAQPMVGGIYTADPQYLSMRATMPQFLEMEQQHGSLIRAMLHKQRSASDCGGDERSALRIVCIVPPGHANPRRCPHSASAGWYGAPARAGASSPAYRRNPALARPPRPAASVGS